MKDDVPVFYQLTKIRVKLFTFSIKDPWSIRCSINASTIFKAFPLHSRFLRNASSSCSLLKLNRKINRKIYSLQFKIIYLSLAIRFCLLLRSGRGLFLEDAVEDLVSTLAISNFVYDRNGAFFYGLLILEHRWSTKSDSVSQQNMLFPIALKQYFVVHTWHA